MSFHWLDVFVFALVVAGAFRGLRRGLVREGMAFLGLAAGVALAHEWHGEVAEALRPFVGGGSWVKGLAYFMIVLLALGAATLLTIVLLRLMRILLVGWLNRVGGIVFGGAQGALVATLVLFFVVKFQFLGLNEAVRNSEPSMVLLGVVLPGALALLPSELAPVAQFFSSPGVP